MKELLRLRNYLTWATDLKKKSLVQALVKRVDIEANNKVHITFRLPLQSKESSGFVIPVAA